MEKLDLLPDVVFGGILEMAEELGIRDVPLTALYAYPMRNEIEWGPFPQYHMTGQYNQHPREAMAARADESRRDDFVGFYDKLISDV